MELQPVNLSVGIANVANAGTDTDSEVDVAVLTRARVAPRYTISLDVFASNEVPVIVIEEVGLAYAGLIAVIFGTG